jgi:hypothetical protein
MLGAAGEAVHPSVHETAMNDGCKIGLKIAGQPGAERAVSAPPVLSASENAARFACGGCGTVLLHAHMGQVRNVIIHCTVCGAYNTTDG